MRFTSKSRYKVERGRHIISDSDSDIGHLPTNKMNQTSQTTINFRELLPKSDLL